MKEYSPSLKFTRLVCGDDSSSSIINGHKRIITINGIIIQNKFKIQKPNISSKNLAFGLILKSAAKK